MRGLLVFLLGAAGCIAPGMLTDGTSVSVGDHATGALRGGRRLPFRGEGYLVPKRWQDRQRNYGADELVELLARSARTVNRMQPHSLLGIADLSQRGGGGTAEHRSHRSGRDVDLLYYSTDLDGNPVTPTEMVYFTPLGASVQPAPVIGIQPEQRVPAEPSTPPPTRLDVARTWTLIKVLVTDPQVSVQWIFVGQPLVQLILQHARRQNEPAYIIERATAVMHQPSDAQSHMDHWHVRIFCPTSDRYQGCSDRGPARWLKKQMKYLDAPPDPGATLNLARLTLRPLGLFGL